MRHRKSGVKLNRTSSHRQAMFRNMVTSLLKHERIQTTDTKAKELRRWADHLITLAKRGDLHARRQALSIVREKQVVHKLFEEAEKRFGKVAGGYTRIVKIGRRSGDAAPISLIELISAKAKTKAKKTKNKTKASGQSKKKATVKTDQRKTDAKKKDEEKISAGETEALKNEEATAEIKEIETKSSATDEQTDVENVKETTATEKSGKTEESSEKAATDDETAEDKDKE